jgi:cyclophilin family peptidyl-prolyl cis-trans isomerase
MVSLKKMPYFDHKYVAIGRLIDGESTLQKIEAVEYKYEAPLSDIEITAISEINQE